MKATSILVCSIGFIGGILAIPAVSLSLAQHPTTPLRASVGVPALLRAGSPDVPTRLQVGSPDAARTRSADSAGGSLPASFFGSTPAAFLGIKDNGCRFYVTTSQADANSWAGASDPRSRPCTPTANSFSPMWSGKPTQAQWTAWQHELDIFAGQYPTISVAQAQSMAQTALAAVSN